MTIFLFATLTLPYGPILLGRAQMTKKIEFGRFLTPPDFSPSQILPLAVALNAQKGPNFGQKVKIRPYWDFSNFKVLWGLRRSSCCDQMFLRPLFDPQSASSRASPLKHDMVHKIAPGTV